MIVKVLHVVRGRPRAFIHMLTRSLCVFVCQDVCGATDPREQPADVGGAGRL